MGADKTAVIIVVVIVLILAVGLVAAAAAHDLRFIDPLHIFRYVRKNL